MNIKKLGIFPFVITGGVAFVSFALAWLALGYIGGDEVKLLFSWALTGPLVPAVLYQGDGFAINGALSFILYLFYHWLLLKAKNVKRMLLLISCIHFVPALIYFWCMCFYWPMPGNLNPSFYFMFVGLWVHFIVVSLWLRLFYIGAKTPFTILVKRNFFFPAGMIFSLIVPPFLFFTVPWGMGDASYLPLILITGPWSLVVFALNKCFPDIMPFFDWFLMLSPVLLYETYALLLRYVRVKHLPTILLAIHISASVITTLYLAFVERARLVNWHFISKSVSPLAWIISAAIFFVPLICIIRIFLAIRRENPQTVS